MSKEWLWWIGLLVMIAPFIGLGGIIVREDGWRTLGLVVGIVVGAFVFIVNCLLLMEIRFK